MSKPVIQPYLFFGGRCEAALEFYKTTIGAQVEMVMHFNESPDPLPPGMLQPGFENKVMHAEFRVGETQVMASDGSNDQSKFDGFRLALTVASEHEAHRVFAALTDGGETDMPLGQTFWSPCFGMVTDRFGVGWMVIVQPEDSE